MSNYLLMPAEAKEHHRLVVDSLASNCIESPAESYCVVTFLCPVWTPTNQLIAPTLRVRMGHLSPAVYQHNNTPLYNPIHYSALFHFIRCSLTSSAADNLRLIMYLLNKGHPLGIFHTIIAFFCAFGLHISWEEHFRCQMALTDCVLSPKVQFQASFKGSI